MKLTLALSEAAQSVRQKDGRDKACPAGTIGNFLYKKKANG